MPLVISEFLTNFLSRYRISQQIFRITPFLPLAISEFLSRYRSFSSDITADIQDYPFLASPDIRDFLTSQRTSGPIWHAISGYTDITAKKLRCRPRHQNIRTSALLQMSGLICYLPRCRPPPAALAIAQGLQLLQPLGPPPVWSTCTP